ncbi:PLP-dependent aminotransferase family protein [Serratia bockelmannii]|uniref:aminotransferase-like domain-containing protein n=1 Tax=Serratia bockelmannii TaxID=2703793 RepID=UPI00313EAFE1
MKNKYKVIVDRYVDLIRSGEMMAGTRLPTHRNLAACEHISLATATRVYAELQAMGLISGEIGRGTFVREIAIPHGHGIDQHAVATDIIDLNFNYPALPGQGELLREALRQVSGAGDIESHLRCQPHAGRLSDREIIAGHLSRGEFHPDADNVIIVNGAQHGLTVTVMGLLRPGDVVAVDALTYSGFKALGALYQLELVAIPVQNDGPDLDALRRICQSRHVRAMYIMPTLHNPLGWVLSHEQRKELVDIARLNDLLIIEDAAYHYLVKTQPPAVAFFAPERTVYVTGFSKNVATGLRIGVVICPEKFRPALERAVRATTWNTPSLIVSMICNWIQDGTVSRFETLKRRDARQRQQILKEILDQLPCISHPDSYFAWLPLPEEVRADRVVKTLMERNISVSTAEPFCITQNAPQAIRIALGSVSYENLRKALQMVRNVIEWA